MFVIAVAGDSALLKGLGVLANRKDLGRGRRYLALEDMDPRLYRIGLTAWTARILEDTPLRRNRHPFIHDAITAAQRWQCHCRTRRLLLSAGHFVKSEKLEITIDVYAGGETADFRAKDWRAASALLVYTVYPVMPATR